jgi:D-alanyl-D-alanine carboxypeptidase
MQLAYNVNMHLKHSLPVIIFTLLTFIIPGCKKTQSANSPAAQFVPDTFLAGEKSSTEAGTVSVKNTIEEALAQAEIPDSLCAYIMETHTQFLEALDKVLQGDAFLRRLVDKKHALPAGYAPGDLVLLGGNSKKYIASKKDIYLRAAAEDALNRMGAAAAGEGITLVASSAYRSYDYQVEVYNRIVKEMGAEAADRESSRPGFSQHQTGLACDFGSITDEFAQTKAGKWLTQNAARFGWSLSFPDGYEGVTGYRWESWHYRYVGVPLASFIDEYFGGIQQYALQFIWEWDGSR